MADFKTMFLRILWILLVMKSVHSASTTPAPITLLTTTNVPTTTLPNTTTIPPTTLPTTTPTTLQKTTATPNTTILPTTIPTTLSSMPATTATAKQTSIATTKSSPKPTPKPSTATSSSPNSTTAMSVTKTTLTTMKTTKATANLSNLTRYPTPTPTLVPEMTPIVKTTESPQITNSLISGGHFTEETNSTEAIVSTTTTTPKPTKSTPKSTVILTPYQPTMPSKGTTEAQNGSKSKSKSYDRELVIIFGVMLGLMFVVIVIFGIHKCRHRNKESDDLPMSSADKYRNGGEDVTIAASSF